MQPLIAPHTSASAAVPGPDGEASLERVLADRAIFPLYQPIVDLRSRNVVAVEALARGPAGSALHSPDALFRAAIEQDRLTELDQLCCERAMVVARDAGTPVPPLVFVNAEPAALTRPMSSGLLAAVSSDLGFRTVLEFTERSLAAAPAALLRVAEQTHAFGNAVALDDVGADPLSLAFLPLIEPQVVKLDMQLLRSPRHRHTIATAAAVSAFAQRCDAIVLAEGVETEQDALNAAALGATWGQGWLFGRPGPLTALAGRRIDAAPPALAVTAPGVDEPTATPFTVAAEQGRVRRADRAMVDAVIDYVFAEIGADATYGVVMCALDDREDVTAWLPRLQALTATAGYVGLLTPGTVPAARPVEAHTVGAGAPMAGEIVLGFIGVHRTLAVAIRRERGGESAYLDLVITEDRDLAQTMTRMLLKRLPTW